MTPREAADAIADLVWKWSKEAGSPLVLAVEDREEIAAIVRGVGEPTALDVYMSQHCAYCCRPGVHDTVACRDAWVAEARSLRRP